MNPACESIISFFDVLMAVLLVVAHAASPHTIATAPMTFVNVNNFFICFGFILGWWFLSVICILPPSGGDAYRTLVLYGDAAPSRLRRRPSSSSSSFVLENRAGMRTRRRRQNGDIHSPSASRNR